MLYTRSDLRSRDSRRKKGVCDALELPPDKSLFQILLDEFPDDFVEGRPARIDIGIGPRIEFAARLLFIPLFEEICEG